jgi:hypothetical protein
VAVSPRFRAGSDYYEIWHEGHIRPVCRETLVRNLARRVRKPQRLVSYSLDVLMNPKHRSNRGRCHADLLAYSRGKVLLVAGA